MNVRSSNSLYSSDNEKEREWETPSLLQHPYRIPITVKSDLSRFHAISNHTLFPESFDPTTYVMHVCMYACDSAT